MKSLCFYRALKPRGRLSSTAVKNQRFLRGAVCFGLQDAENSLDSGVFCQENCAIHAILYVRGADGLKAVVPGGSPT